MPMVDRSVPAYVAFLIPVFDSTLFLPLGGILYRFYMATTRKTGQSVEQYLNDFVTTYNFGHPLKTLKGFSPYEFIYKCWTKEPERFRLNPIHQIPGD